MMLVKWKFPQTYKSFLGKNIFPKRSNKNDLLYKNLYLIINQKQTFCDTLTLTFMKFNAKLSALLTFPSIDYSRYVMARWLSVSKQD